MRSERFAVLGRLRRSEDGFGIAEVVVALSVLAVGLMGVAATMMFGFRQVAVARQRQAGTEVANTRVEHLRNLSYTSVALSTQPVHSDDPENPDYYVSEDGTQYDYTGDGTWETLIVDTDQGQVLHLEDPVTVGPTTMEVFQYATWVDDPNIAGSQDYRRLTVVVRFKFPAVTGTTRFVRVSSLFTPGTVTLGGTEAEEEPGGTSSPSPSPSPSPSGSCSGDTTPPTGDYSIESTTGSETGYTASVSVTIRMVDLTDGCTPIQARFSNDGVGYGEWVTYDATSPTVSWALVSGDGSKSVYAQFQDGVGNTIDKGPKSIVLDTTDPTVPGTLNATVSCSGDTRTVDLSWGVSSDANLSGYRVYRSINNEPWASLGNFAGTTASDSHKKTLDSVRYRAVAYDKAGNESDPTNEIVLAKNQCS